MSTHSAIDPMLEDAARVISAGQHASGAYIASPNFPEYRFGWLRDGSYVALAMDVLGDRESSRRFHAWVAETVRDHAADVAAVIAARAAQVDPEPASLLPTRYTLDGKREDGAADWPNFQLDGYGTWLFALERHLADSDATLMHDAVRLAGDYLLACHDMPCYDYWEEYGDRHHTSTLAAIAAGLGAAARMTGDSTYQAGADTLVDRIHRDCVVDGAFVKGPEDDRVDASLISLATPFDLVAPDDPIMRQTVARIRAELTSPSGGIRRYVGDTYYGGNPWVLLTAWLGWHLRRAGDLDGYIMSRDWIRSVVDDESRWLPEQTTAEPQPGAEPFVQEWADRWGPVADPLLWSHAKYVLMELADR